MSTRQFREGAALFELPDINRRSFGLRGYDGSSRVGRRMKMGTVEWRVPIADVDRHLMVAPIGQVYATTLYPGVVKGWHLHRAQWDRMVCLSGRVLLGLVDGRADSPTRGAQLRIVLGERHHALVLVPPGVYHGLKNIGTGEAIVVNTVSAPYNRAEPDEVRVAPHGVLPFDWSRTDS